MNLNSLKKNFKKKSWIRSLFSYPHSPIAEGRQQIAESFVLMNPPKKITGLTYETLNVLLGIKVL
jgi:hypothetical protein